MMWNSLKDPLLLPKFGEKVLVKVPDLSYLMMGIEMLLPEGEYTSIYDKKSIYCCNDPRHNSYHKRLHWSNNAGYYATHWMPLPKPPGE